MAASMTTSGPRDARYARFCVAIMNVTKMDILSVREHHLSRYQDSPGLAA